MIRMPEYVTEGEMDKGAAIAFARKKLELVKDIELYQMAEGKCVQMLHIGPFSTESETLEKMNHLIEKNGLTKTDFITKYTYRTLIKLK